MTLADRQITRAVSGYTVSTKKNPDANFDHGQLISTNDAVHHLAWPGRLNFSENGIVAVHRLTNNRVKKNLVLER